MKIAVSSLLLLATLVEWQFVTGSSMWKIGTNSFHARMQKNIKVSPDLCEDLASTNLRASRSCQVIIKEGWVSCSLVFKLRKDTFPPLAEACRYVFDKVCSTPEDPPLPESTTPLPATTTTTQRVRATTASPERGDASPPPDLNCGQSPNLRRREPFMDVGAGLGRIVGGEDTRGCSMVPWQVQVNADFGLCGGAIISRKHILTAAHCLRRVNYTPKYLEVKVGDYELYGSDQKVYSVMKVDAHELYTNFSKINDIAVLTLNESLTFGPCVTPICLDPAFKPNGHFCVVAGWGHTKLGGPTSDVQKMLRVKAYQGSRCEEAFGAHDQYVLDKPAQLCAGHAHGGAGSCQGDSGGPLACWHQGRYVQAGIVSYGFSCARAKSPGIYTSTAFYHSWIMNKIRKKPCYGC